MHEYHCRVPVLRIHLAHLPPSTGCKQLPPVITPSVADTLRGFGRDKWIREHVHWSQRHSQRPRTSDGKRRGWSRDSATPTSQLRSISPRLRRECIHSIGHSQRRHSVREPSIRIPVRPSNWRGNWSYVTWACRPDLKKAQEELRILSHTASYHTHMRERSPHAT